MVVARRVLVVITVLAASVTPAFAGPPRAMVATATPVVADDTATTVTATSPGPAVHHHFVSVELLGKGGLWGAGYEWRTRRFSLGAIGSYYRLGGDQFLTLSPYVGVVPVGGEHLSWFVHAGPQVVRRSTPSPGPEWSGMTSTGFAAEVSTGVEYRWNNLSIRAYAMAALGAHFAPGVGFSLGWSL